MADTTIDDEIKNLKSEIEATRQKLSDMEVVLKYLESKYQRKTITKGDATDYIKSDQIDIDDLFTASKDQRTMIDDVNDAIERFGTREFNVPMVAAVMARLGSINDENDKTVRSRISSILTKLFEEQKLLRTFTGKGSVPHKYKIVEIDDEENLEQDDRDVDASRSFI
ncbi:MAG: hypothetical protein ACXW0M_06675 [Methylosarcina sp.]